MELLGLVALYVIGWKFGDKIWKWASDLLRGVKK